MKPKRKKRLIFIIILVVAVGIALGLTLYALRQNVNLYLTPTQLQTQQVPADRTIRIGGMVKKGSVKHGEGLNIVFVLTDYKHSVKVAYDGALPALFREGQGLVVQGQFNQKHQFIADQVLAKHDNEYVPPGMENAKPKLG